MADMTVLDYAMMVEDATSKTRIIEYRRRGIDSGITRPRRGAGGGGADRRAQRRLSMVIRSSNRRRKSRSPSAPS